MREGPARRAATRAIRSEATLSSTRLLLPSSAVRGTAESARDAGLSAYLTKPIRESQLYDCPASVVTAGAQPARLITRHTVSEDRARHRPLVLVADDNAVLMDCEMPTMDGFEATAEIRRLERGGNRLSKPTRADDLAAVLYALDRDRPRGRCLRRAAGWRG